MFKNFSLYSIDFWHDESVAVQKHSSCKSTRSAKLFIHSPLSKRIIMLQAKYHYMPAGEMTISQFSAARLAQFAALKVNARVGNSPLTLHRLTLSEQNTTRKLYTQINKYIYIRSGHLDMRRAHIDVCECGAIKATDRTPPHNAA